MSCSQPTSDEREGDLILSRAQMDAVIAPMMKDLEADLLAMIGPALNRAFDNGATRMRDKCVEAIKSLRATPRGAAYGNAINDAIHKIESLTLDQVEQEKQ